MKKFFAVLALSVKAAGNAGHYAVTEPLLDLGHDPMNEIE